MSEDERFGRSGSSEDGPRRDHRPGYLRNARAPRIAHDTDARLTGFEPVDESLESSFRYLVHRK